MALIYCRECGQRVSDQAPTCPHCGCPTNTGAPVPNNSSNNNNSNTWLYILIGGLAVVGVIALLSLMGLKGCNQTTPEPRTDTVKIIETVKEKEKTTSQPTPKPEKDYSKVRTTRYMVNSIKGTGAVLRSRPSSSSRNQQVYSDGTMFSGVYEDNGSWISVIKNGRRIGYIHNENVIAY